MHRILCSFILSNHIYPNVTYHKVTYVIGSYHNVTYLIYRNLSYLIVMYATLSYHILSYLNVSCCILSYLMVLYLIDKQREFSESITFISYNEKHFF